MSSTPPPGHPPRTRKTHRITLRLDHHEHQVLVEKASAVGLPLGGYLRELGLGRRLRARRHHLDGRAVAQLSRVGNNLRQLVRVATEAGDATTKADLEETFEHLQETIAPLLAGFTDDDP